MVSTRPPISKYSSPFNNPLVTVLKAPITIGIIFTFMFHSFFNSLARSRNLSFFSHSFIFILWSAGTVNPIILEILFFLLLLFSLVFWLRLGNPSLCQSPIGVYVCHFLGQKLGCAYTICLYGQISISCASPCGSHCPPTRVSSYTPSVLIIIIIIIYSFRVFHISVSWWFFTRVWLIASLLMSPGLVSGF